MLTKPQRDRATRDRRMYEYYIAELAKVPVVLGFIDFKTKTCGYGPSFIPSGDFEKDWPVLEEFYRGMQGKKKGCFNLE